jgi:DNA-binding MarR family transcriptional regulator
MSGIEVETSWSRELWTHRKSRFLKGPIPWALIEHAGQLPGKALAVFLAAWHRGDLQGQAGVTLPADLLAAFGVDKHAKRRALNELEKAGLVRVERRSGTRAIVYPKRR